MALGSVVVDLLLKTGAFSNDAKQAERRMAEMGKKAREAGRVIGTALAGALTATGVAAMAMTRSTVEASERIERLTRLSGTTTETFQRWAAAAQTVGIEQDKLGDLFKDTSDKVGDFLQTGGGAMADFFENVAPKVGVTAEQFRKLSGPQALQLYVDSLEKANLSQSEMVFYLEALANDATLLLPLLQKNGQELNALADQAERYGVILDSKAIAASQELRKEFIELDQMTTGLSRAVGVQLVPAVRDLTDLLGNPEAQQAIRDAAGLIGTIGSAAVKATGQIAGLIGQYREFLADRGFVPGDELHQLQARRDQFAERLAVMESKPTFLGSEKVLADMRKEIAKLDEQIKGFPFRNVTTSFGSTATDPERPTTTTTTEVMTAATRQLAEATKELTAAEQEALAYKQSLNAIGEETLRMRGQAEQALLAEQEAVQRVIADLQFESSLIGMTNLDREKAIALRWAGVDATTAEGQAIAGLIEQMDAAREAQGFMQDMRAGMGDLFDGILEGSNAASEAFSRMIDRMRQRAMDMLADRVFEGLLQGFAGLMGGGGWSGFGSGFRSGFGGGRATGGPVHAGTTYLVGENGPELLHMGRNSGTVVPNNRLASLGAGGPQVNVAIHNAPHGADVQTRPNANGGVDIDVIFQAVEGRMASNVANGTGALYAAQRGRFGLRDAV